MKRSRVRPAGFTLTELLVVLLIIAVLSAIAYPVGKSIIARSRSTACIAKLRDIGAALESYLQDNAQTMPNMAAGRKNKAEEVAVLDTELRPYLSNPEAFHCPADHKLFEHSGCSYIWNSTQSGRNRNSLDFFGKSGTDKRIPLVTDKEEWHPGESGVNILYADLSASNKLRFGINR
jgi:prepilin-type N-terminal cleavage/methylation domain-containing protein